jgi:hypothetical protein
MIEDRHAPRHNTCLFRAFVYFEGNGAAINCVVRDISETAARLQFHTPQDFPECLDLHIPAKGRSFHAKVQWIDGDEIGIAFHAAGIPDPADSSLEQRLDRLEAEVALLKQSVKHLQKNAENNEEAA